VLVNSAKKCMNKIMCFETENTALPLCLEQVRVWFLEEQVVLGLWGNCSTENLLFSTEGPAVNFSLGVDPQPLYEMVLPSTFSIQNIRVEFGSCVFKPPSFMESWSVLEAWDGDRAVLVQMAWHGGSFVSLDAGILQNGAVEPVYALTKDHVREALCFQKL
jgi:hypothetical protein